MQSGEEDSLGKEKYGCGMGWKGAGGGVGLVKCESRFLMQVRWVEIGCG